jgi:hypothetical protein
MENKRVGGSNPTCSTIYIHASRQYYREVWRRLHRGRLVYGGSDSSTEEETRLQKARLIFILSTKGRDLTTREDSSTEGEARIQRARLFCGGTDLYTEGETSLWRRRLVYGTTNRVVVPARQAGHRFLDSLTDLQIRAQNGPNTVCADYLYMTFLFVPIVVFLCTYCRFSLYLLSFFFVPIVVFLCTYCRRHQIHEFMECIFNPPY